MCGIRRLTVELAVVGVVVLASVEVARAGEVCEIRSGGSSMICNCDDTMTAVELAVALNDELLDVGSLTLV